MSSLSEQQVLGVRHWTDTLFSVKTTREASFRYQSGQFVMIGLEVNGRPLLRAYSLASAHYEEELEFFSIKVPDGPLTSRLQHIAPGDRILVGRKATGTLLLDNLLPGRNLYLIGTGTGLAPFLSLIKDPDTYERFENVVLVHGVRHVAELAYGEEIARLPSHELVGELLAGKLIYCITDLITTGRLFEDTELPAIDSGQDRVMLCGSPDMLAQMTILLRENGFEEGSSSAPGSYVVEKAFVEK
jgi:ferredoxin--NADP+ reductase